MNDDENWYWGTILLCSMIALNEASRPEDRTILRPRWW